MERLRRITDPRALQALAHPVRFGIVEHLSVEGALTATQLAERLDESPANCSWHLRKLAEHGFVEEAEGGHGRRRPWQVTAEGLSFADADGPGARRAATALEHVIVDRAVSRFHRSRAHAEPGDDALGTLQQHALWLSPGEATELYEAMSALVERFHPRLRDAAARPEGARLVELLFLGAPVDHGEGRDDHVR